MQLALDPVRRGEWPLDGLCTALRGSGVSITSGMMGFMGEDYASLESIRRTGGVRLDEHWEENLRAAHQNAALAADLGVSLVTLHAGFLPHDQADPLRGVMVSRLREVARAFDARGVRVGLETGQEDAGTLLGVLAELGAGNVGVNFDPANMILYGMGEPVEAFRRLATHVLQVHIKDALPSSRAGDWGREVVAGAGSVDWRGLFDAISALCPRVPLVIEREAGDSRVQDIRAAADLIRRMVA